MYDMHYDLLTILYFNLKKGNPLADEEKLKSDLKKIYADKNILGGIINLFFMSEKEMKEELGLTKEELQDVKKMFKTSLEYLEAYKKQGIIPSNLDFLYSIEGCDFLTDENDLDELYDLGLRAILPVWNEENKFASGIRSDKGLTPLGEKLIKKAIDLGIIIDLSHANIASYNDILDVIEAEKKNGKQVTFLASHSNVRTLCDRERNLTDEQLIRLRDTGGYIGLFTNGNFLDRNNRNLPYIQRQKKYLKHLRYIIQTLEFQTDRILVSTDDMNYNPDKSYHHLEAFDISDIKEQLYKLISEAYSEELADDILVNNPRKIIQKVKTKK